MNFIFSIKMMSSILVIFLFSTSGIQLSDGTKNTVAIALDNLNLEFGAKVQDEYRNLVEHHDWQNTLRHDPAMQQVVESLMSQINDAQHRTNGHGKVIW